MLVESLEQRSFLIGVGKSLALQALFLSPDGEVNRRSYNIFIGYSDVSCAGR